MTASGWKHRHPSETPQPHPTVTHALTSFEQTVLAHVFRITGFMQGPPGSLLTFGLQVLMSPAFYDGSQFPSSELYIPNLPEKEEA